MALLQIENIKLVGIAATVPAKTESNFGLDYLTDSEKTSLITTTGIEKRRIADSSITAADLCLRSAQNILLELNWKPEEIDILIFVTQTPDYAIPGTSMFIQSNLGIRNTCICFDINQGCAGYVYGLSVIGSMMSAGKLQKGLLLVGDTITKTISPNDKSLVPVFSDAGSCTALEFSNSNESVMSFNLQTDGRGYDKIIIKEGGARHPVLGKNAFLQMNGQDIFNFGLKEVVPNVNSLLTQYDLSIREIDYFVMHQANLLLNESIRKKLEMDITNTLYSLKEYGNTSCASIPVTLAANYAKLHMKDDCKVLLAGFGVGLSWGSAVIHFNQVKCLRIDEL